MALEARLVCGQCEELIVQAENELVLAKKMLQWKPWEPLVQQAPGSQWKWPISASRPVPCPGRLRRRAVLPCVALGVYR